MHASFGEEALPYLDAVYRFAVRLTGSRDEAADLTQETFLRALGSGSVCVRDALQELGRSLTGRGPRGESITCDEALAALYGYLDGELVAGLHERVKAHFEMCAKCFPQLRVEEVFRLAVQRAARGEKAPPSLCDRLSLLARKADEDVRAGPGGDWGGRLPPRS